MKYYNRLKLDGKPQNITENPICLIKKVLAYKKYDRMKKWFEVFHCTKHFCLL